MLDNTSRTLSCVRGGGKNAHVCGTDGLDVLRKVFVHLRIDLDHSTWVIKDHNVKSSSRPSGSAILVEPYVGFSRDAFSKDVRTAA